ncbi:MAG: DMT family transporter [Victivallaceae bacterium]|nr:DMT family transporter [Victivallaceae bacterium]
MKIDRNAIIGYVSAIVSGITYGLNPFFGLKLYDDGFTTPNVLFYRLLFASMMLGGLMLARHDSFRVPRKALLPLLFEGVMLYGTCMFLFLSYRLMSSGAATTLMYTYPVLIALVLYFFYHERLTWTVISGIALSFVGVACVCSGKGTSFSALGVTYAILSGAAYGIYLLAVKKSPLRAISPTSLTFYSSIIGMAIMFAQLGFGTKLQPIGSIVALGCVLGLSFFTTFLAFLLVAVAIRHIGETKSAVVAALEPVTAVAIGIYVFDEPVSWIVMLGIVLVLAAVTLVVVGGNRKEEELAK